MTANQLASQLPVEILRKPRLRTMKLRVRSSGLIQLTCGMSVKEPEIRKFLEQAKPFIKKSLSKLLKIQSQLPPPLESEKPWTPWLGDKLAIVLDSHARTPFIENNNLHLKIKNVETLRSFYKKQAPAILDDRMQYWSQTMNLRPKKVSLRGQKSRWGSCSAKGVINLNWKILIAPMSVIDYLMVHELSHLKHHNHGPGFWGLVELFQPDYRVHEKWLRENQHLAEFLEAESEFYNAAVNRETIEKILTL